MTSLAPPRAITLAVTPGKVAEEACRRLAAVCGSRCELPSPQVEEAAVTVTAIARAMAAHLAEGTGNIELTIVEMPGAMQITFGLLRPGGSRALLLEIGDARPDGHPVSLTTAGGERLSYEVSSAPIVGGAVPGGSGANGAAPYAAVESLHPSGVPVLAVTGEIDLSTAPALELAARHALVTGGHRLVLDLGDSSFLDSTGLRVLIGLAGACGDDGGVAIANMNSAIARALEITGLSSVFSIHATVDEAARALSAR